MVDLYLIIMKTENTPFLASLRSDYEEFLKKIQENPEIISKQSFRLKVAGLLKGLEIAEESKMDLTGMRSIQIGIQEILKKFPKNVRSEIDQLIKDTEPELQVDNLEGKDKEHVPSWMGGKSRVDN